MLADLLSGMKSHRAAKIYEWLPSMVCPRAEKSDWIPRAPVLVS